MSNVSTAAGAWSLNMSATFAQSLSFNSTWLLNMTTLAQSKTENETLAHNPAWGIVDLVSGANMQMVNDPTSSGNQTPVLKVNYPAGSYQSPLDTKDNSTVMGSAPGGAQFYFHPHSVTASRALLEYEIYISPNFEFNQGGKLPGLFGSDGRVGNMCNGGEVSDGTTCWSMRLMWRAGGNGEAYAYLPVAENNQMCGSKNIICSSIYGSSINRGAFQFTTGKWISLSIFVQLNTPGLSDGSIVVYTDKGQNRAISRGNVVYRAKSTTDKSLLIQSIMFSTFYGGHTGDWAAPVSTWVLFRNMQISMANDRIANRASGLFSTMSLWIVSVASLISLVIALW
ncbi:hypothetical protein BDV3_003629 [Batrachochytrium dendrobatidis]|uniref:Polysaccharide lyase 14 domain-containing protein n=1 Tax=Batrachochytrium dendrobatidis (strain JEL423) TaxID=403673 RepID=A0A177WE20_BATDL|nr:hypothetical protein BDEG_22005 [Batrachochytrium dendrobatidis JEL423]